jgi:PHS family inorganic phosphate transporter-like MFS transporter
VATIDTLGRKPIQLMGFTLLTIIFVCIGFAYDKLLKHNGALLALYVLAQFFFNFGKAPFEIISWRVLSKSRA